jgi:hypothetical protein
MPIIITEFEQGSPEWFAAKSGNVGASSVDKIITASGDRSKSRNDFMYQIAGERITGCCEETYQSQAMLNGIEREDSARLLFEMIKDVECKKVGIVFKDEWKLCHCSPDSLIGVNEGLEIKNPMMKTHVKYLLSRKLPVEYVQQIQMSLYVTEREKWHFMSNYEGLPPLIIEVGRDEEFIKKLEIELNAFNEEMLTVARRITEISA